MSTATGKTDSAPKGTVHGGRVFEVVAAFTRLGGDVHSLKDISEEAGLNEATAYRIIQSGLPAEAFEQVDRGRYRLGSGSTRIAIEALSHSPDPATMHAVLDELHQTTGWLAAYYRVMGSKRLCLDYAIGDFDPRRIDLDPAELTSVSRSLRTGASGRAILAHLPQSVRDRVLAEPVPEGVGPGVIRDNAQLVASLEDIRERGYAVGRQECMPGWDSVAVPVCWGDTIQGSALLLVLADQMPTDPTRFIDATVRAATQLSRLVSMSPVT
ncbi:IclR family transcriptional regulator [Streptomyces rimosus]|uniref:IclR family transcriptional regulator n=1 Tax=Streptomyces rimosus TaxID=1927 RepID=UPI00067C2CB4|nr:IclR family transcriptional regulator C-terminal domain-containing protein [Streptomyces rimosus]